MEQPRQVQTVGTVRDTLEALPTVLGNDRLGKAQVFVEDVFHGPNVYSCNFSVSERDGAIVLSTSLNLPRVTAPHPTTRDRVLEALERLEAAAKTKTLMLEDCHQGPGKYTDDVVITVSDDGGTILICTGTTHDGLTG